ncbi:MAG: hypothetical protein QE285_00040 [Aquabacterium sp.]|nr:hypothetical protein [Aquabacterium sp.]
MLRPAADAVVVVDELPARGGHLDRQLQQPVGLDQILAVEGQAFMQRPQTEPYMLVRRHLPHFSTSGFQIS